MGTKQRGFIAGHHVECDCIECAPLRARHMVDHALQHGVTDIRSVNRTVFVRQYTVKAHMRTNRRHLSKKPHTLAEMRRYLRSLMAMENVVASIIKKGKRNGR